MKHCATFTVLLLITISAYSQDNGAVVPPIPAVSIADLEERIYAEDSSAQAAYLYIRGKTYYENKGTYLWDMVTEVYKRIKIYKKDGFDYADASIRYYSGNSRGTGFFKEVATYNLVNGVIEKTPLTSDGEFSSHPRDNYTEKKIKLPNVKEGSIVEYKYEIRTPHVGLRDWYFQYDIPVKDVRYDVSVPVYFSYNPYIIGYVPVEVAPQKLLFNNANKSTDKYYTYSAKKVKAFKDEAYVSNKKNYISTLSHQLTAMYSEGVVAKEFTLDWKKIAKSIYEDDRFGFELRRTSYYNNEINPLIGPLTTDIEKMNEIFTYVQNRMKWDEYGGYYCRDGVKKAYDIRKGNAAEINLMLVSMLRHANLDASPVLVSTRSNGVPFFPTDSSYDYVIAAVKTGGKTILLDATSKFSQPDILPLRALNWEGMLIKKDGSSEIADLTPKLVSRENYSVVAEVATDGIFKGKAKVQYVNHSAYVYREVLAVVSSDKYVEAFEEEKNGITINAHKINNLNDVSKPLIEEYDFSHTMVSDVIGDKIYFSPLLYFSVKENLFKQETREYPVDFTYPKQEKYMFFIKIPSGYKVEFLPKALTITMEENIGSFMYNLKQEGNTIQLVATLDINHHTVMPEYYQTLKDFFQKMIEKQNEKVILTRI
ncbi:DUF3857 domain-containing protein [Flavobacterium zepuense]|uniref:DUF3857 domain-containing protein n=1 Tax=Flavobacterium zepuense TaxID=2593302 RepID=A0A552V469_9FLAO|nr:DUF3857 domain-containing protein [Flavobacterium zepuense]TRW25276.1 DUF3857 domain-containing protein [Flavobacterium zepuense]